MQGHFQSLSRNIGEVEERHAALGREQTRLMTAYRELMMQFEEARTTLASEYAWRESRRQAERWPARLQRAWSSLVKRSPVVDRPKARPGFGK